MSFAVEGPVLEIKSLGPAPKVITVRVEPIAKRVRAYVDGAAITDSRHGPSSRAHGTPTAGGRHNRRYEMSSQVQPFALEPGAGTSVRNPVGGQLVFKLRGEQSNGAMTVFETVAAPEEGPPLHFHQLQDEWLYVLEGEMRIRLGDDVVPAPAGSFAFIPRGVAHTWQNSGREPALLLAMFAPAGLEQFFERYAELTEQTGDLDTFRALAPAAGMTVVGPPLAQSHPTYTRAGREFQSVPGRSA